MPETNGNDRVNPKVYLASPFFNEKQLAFVKTLETVITSHGYELFSPRLGGAAIEMNGLLTQGKPPSAELRHSVFLANVENIADADLVVANIDDLDSGVLFEMGYAFAVCVPIVSITQEDHGSNLMLAESIIGHLKSLEDLNGVLDIGNPGLTAGGHIYDYAECVARITDRFKSTVALKEGPSERA